MNLRQLEILHAVLREETTAGAARLLGLSQPAVSNAIKHMEGQLGFALFERINNRLFPTEAARTIAEDAEPLFATYRALELRLQDLREDKVSRLRLLSTPPLGHGTIPAAMESLLRRQPRLRIFFDVRHLDEVVQSVESGQTDLGFGLSLGHHPGLQVQPIFQGRMVCVCRADHPLAGAEAVAPADLARHGFIALDAETRMGAALREAFMAERAPLSARAEVRYCETACVLAEAGLGAAVVDPFSAARAMSRGLVIRPFLPAIPSAAFAFWSLRRPLSPLARQFLAETVARLARTLGSLPAQPGAQA